MCETRAVTKTEFLDLSETENYNTQRLILLSVIFWICLNIWTATEAVLAEKPTSARMLSRSARAETRQSRKEDIKRVMHSVDKVMNMHIGTTGSMNIAKI